jgi:phosphoribosylaminoimidazolecarboxamide formyltransferase/IMP cyclohydrolase
MEGRSRITSALISVYNKDGLESIVRRLSALGVTMYSTGGTENYIRSLGLDVQAVESLTSYPSILGGRVKTLHPKVFGGILSRRANEADNADLLDYEIPTIDLVVVDLYPFEETLASGGTHHEIIEKIDIGGISLIRAASKNYQDVVVIPSQRQYERLWKILNDDNGFTVLTERRKLAAEGFAVSSHYDAAILGYMQEDDLHFRAGESGRLGLRYGENPHQQGAFYGDLDSMITKLSGKELSYNNLLDVDAAVNLMAEFRDESPAFAILKHNNACGVAIRPSLAEAWKAALAGDPISAFGGVLIANTAVDMDSARMINELFFEVIIAPEYQSGVVDFLTAEKKNRIVLHLHHWNLQSRQYRSILNGALVQDRDNYTDTAGNLEPRTLRTPTQAEISDLLFAQKLVKQTRSNAIVLAKDNQLLASGTGQTSRVDALNQAIEKARRFGFDLQNAVMASDAFFPFPDCVEIAHQAGIRAVIQPGGSVKDQLSIDFCNSHDMAMVFTGIRHFKH